MKKNGDLAPVRSQVIPVWQPAFLAELTHTGSVASACRAAGIGIAAVSSWRQRNQDFDQQVIDLLRSDKLRRDSDDRLIETTPTVWRKPFEDDPERTVEEVFLETLGRTLNASESCRRVGVPYESYCRRRQRDPEFASRVALAIGRACDELEGALYQRALLESDAAAVSMLRAYRPDVYRTDNKPQADPSQPSLEESMKRGYQRARALPEGQVEDDASRSG